MVRRQLHFALFVLMLTVWGNGLHAQQYYNQDSRFLKYNSVWAFYNNVKLNFNTGAASNAAAMGQATDEGCASVADPVTGALLFYSNGGTCWTSNNTVMPNGSDLLGNPTGLYSTTQGVCIVPVPGETQKYYLFSLETSTTATPVQICYSIIDMSLNNGLGDIIAGTKNTILDNTSILSEGMIAIQGNNCDVWLMLHTKTTPVFKAYHITTSGIDPNPVISTTGGQIQGSVTFDFGGFPLQQEAYEQCAMAISPDRNRLAVSCQHLAGMGFPVISATGRGWGGLLCKFDPNTGSVSNGMLIDTLTQYSAAFSPDNSKLYFTSFASGSSAQQLSQLTISSNDSAQIVATKALIHAPLTSNTLIGIRAYHDTIYVINPGSLSLDRINKPNLAGIACNYQSNAISFPGATGLGSTLPNEVVAAAAPDTLRSRVLDTLICSKWSNGIILHPAIPALGNNYSWNNGSSGSTLSVSAAGTYWVRYGNSCHYRTDTFVLAGSDITPVITVNGLQLGTTTPYSTYQWYLNNILIPGATSATIMANQNGAYTVVVSNGVCTATSAVYNVTNVTATNDLQQLIQQISIYPNPAKHIIYINAPEAINVKLTDMSGRTLQRFINPKSISFGNYAKGLYLLHVSNKEGIMLKVEKLILE